MATWRIRVFGSGGMERTDTGAIEMPDIWWPVLGCVLAAPGQRASRSRIAGQLWPDKDESSARHCLASALWRIKARLPRGDSPITTAEDRIALKTSERVWIDALVFERRAAAVIAHPELLVDATQRQRAARALALYRSDFLIERDQEAIILERERLRILFLDAQYELAMAQSKAFEWVAARSSATMLCLAEPLREDAQRLLIVATARCGNRALALRLYRNFEGLLARELGVQPMPETVDLLAEIEGSRPLQSRPKTAPPVPADYRGALVRTRDQIAETLQMVEAALAP